LIKFAHWTGPKGIDDLLVACGTYTLSDDPGDRPVDSRVAEINTKYCVVVDGGKTLVLSFKSDRGHETPVFQTCSDFISFHQNQHVVVDGKHIGLGTY
jgi:hypothetical protein